MMRPAAIVEGQPVQSLPPDLYVPPDALRVLFEAFEGPLDLLLYLIKRQSFDVLKLPITLVTEQYMQYIEMMHKLRLDVAAEYLAMAALLAEIKSRMLLPRPPQDEDEDEDEADPRAELIRRLLAYQQFRQAAAAIDRMQRLERDIFEVHADASGLPGEKKYPRVTLQTICLAFQDAVRKAARRSNYRILREPLSVRDRMTVILSRVAGAARVPFSRCFTAEEGRGGVVVSFVAVLEMLRAGVIEVVQAEACGPIYLRMRSTRA